YLFELFSFEALKFIERSLDFLIKSHADGGIIEVLNETIAKPFVTKKLTNSYLYKNQFTLNLWDHVMYYAILKYDEKNNVHNYEHLQNWMRIIRNLAYNTYI